MDTCYLKLKDEIAGSEKWQFEETWRFENDYLIESKAVPFQLAGSAIFSNAPRCLLVSELGRSEANVRTFASAAATQLYEAPATRSQIV